MERETVYTLAAEGSGRVKTTMNANTVCIFTYAKHARITNQPNVLYVCSVIILTNPY